MPPETAREYTVVFDGTCGVCTRIAAMLDTLDVQERLEIVSAGDAGVGDRFPWIPSHAYADALQLIARDHTTWQGAAAIEQLLRVLPRGMWIGWIFNIPFARPVADRFYAWFARNRYRLGCGNHCTTRH